MELDFPARPGRSVPTPALLEQGLRSRPREVLKSRDYMAVFDDARQVAAMEPDFGLLARLDSLGIIVTAPGGLGDFVSRFFAPSAGVNEDPVTGSAHCTLIPYWAERLGRTQLSARQVSRRGGELECRLERERVGIAGRCFTYLRGDLDVPDPGS